MKKILKKIAIIFSIIILIIDIIIFFKMNLYKSIDINSLIWTLLHFSTLIYGMILIPIVWIEYCFIILLINVYNKFNNLKRILLLILVSILIFILLIILLKIFILLIFVLLS